MKKVVSLVLVVSMLAALLCMSGGIGALAFGRGDADCDGSVTSKDARKVLDAAVNGIGSWNSDQLSAGDYNGDDAINTLDARAILERTVAGTVDYVNITKTDAFGDRGIAFLGDSISHGANAPDIPTQSYVGRLKQAINNKVGTNNYGFTTVEGTLTNPYGTYNEMHEMPVQTGAWEFRRGSQFLGTRAFDSTQHWATLDFTMRQNYKYFCVYYHTGTNNGVFSVETIGAAQPGIVDISGGGMLVDTADTTAHPARTNFYECSQLVDRKIRIAVQSDDNKEVIITGIGYYNTLDGQVLNNYANSGLLLSGYDKTGSGNGQDVTGLDTSILDLAAKSETLIFALGYNDSHAYPSTHHEDFTYKINHLIRACKQNDTKVVVNDLCWYYSATEHQQVQYYKDELQRLALETGGIYVDQQAIHGDNILNYIDDTAHPNPTGHQMIAEALINAMGINA